MPEAVARIALAIPSTVNIEVRATLAGIARSLPASLAASFADKVDDWLTPKTDPAVAYRLTDNIIGLLENLVNLGADKAGRSVLAAILRPIPPAEREDGFSRAEPETRLATWDLREIMGRLSPLVLRLREPGLDIVVDSLDQALAMDCGNGTHEWEDDSLFWCPAIENHAADYADSLLAHLVSLARDTGVRLIDSAPSCLAQVVGSFEARRWVIFRRLAFFLLQKFPSAAPSMAAARLVDRSCFDLPGPEYARLLRSHFAQLSEDQQRVVLSWIEKGPEQVAPSDTSRDADRWRMEWLATIADALPAGWRRRYEALKGELGQVPAVDEFPPDELPPPRTRPIGPTSPFRGEALAQLSPAEVVDKIQSWPAPSGFAVPEPEGLSRTLASVVEKRPDVWAAAIEDVKRLDPTYLRGVLSGFRAVTGAGNSIDWKRVVDLCAWVSSRPREIPGRKATPFGLDAHWGSARHHMLLLLSNGLTSNRVAIPVDLRGSVWSAIEPTLYDSSDAEDISQVEDRPLEYVLNRVQGFALVTSIEYAFWLARQTGSTILPEEVREALEAKLRAGSVAVRVAIADRINMMTYVDNAWTAAHVRALFKPDKTGRDLAWETYLSYDRLTLDAFRLLRWRYKIAIDGLRADAILDHRTQELVHHLGNHLALLYWNGQLGLDEDDRLIEGFFANTPSAVTGKLVEDIGRWLHTGGQPTPEVLTRLRALWTRRFAIRRSEELAAFRWWFSSGRFDETWALDNFLDCLRALDADPARPLSWYAPKLGERLAELAAQHPGKVVSCLELLVKANDSGWGILEIRASARTILAAALASDDNDVKRVARSTIGRLARKGYPEFRALL